jgi:phage terminase large subunit-like protein
VCLKGVPTVAAAAAQQQQQEQHFATSCLAPNAVYTGLVCNVSQNEQTVNNALLLQGQEAVQADLACAFPPVNKDLQLQRSLLGKRHAEDVTDHYEIGRVLGAGHYGTTRIALHKTTGEMYACKSINKSRWAAECSSPAGWLGLTYRLCCHMVVLGIQELPA